MRYVVFLAPGLLAASAMQTGMGEASWPVFGAVKWTRSYVAMLATPLTVDDVVVGHLAFMAMRVALNTAVFGIVVAVFGLAPTAAGLVLALALSRALAGLLYAVSPLDPLTFAAVPAALLAVAAAACVAPARRAARVEPVEALRAD